MLPMEVINKYDLTINKAIEIFCKPNRKVWKLFAQEGEFAFKAMRIPPRRVQFLTEAHEYLQKNSDLVPALLLTREGEPYVDDAEKRYTVSEWIQGCALDYQNRNHLELVFKALAMFHKASLGFKPSSESNPRQYLGDWPEIYRIRMERLLEFRAQIKKGRKDPLVNLFLNAFGSFWKQAEEACSLLENAPYLECCSQIQQMGGFCHQDFTLGNLTLYKHKVMVYDFDGIATDLPARDLRILVNDVFIKLGHWDPALLQRLLECYQSQNPIDEGQRQVFLADLMFPHPFYTLIKKHYFDLKKIHSQTRLLKKMEQVLASERQKYLSCQILMKF